MCASKADLESSIGKSMTIKSIETIPVSLPFDVWGPKSAFAGRPRSMDILLVCVETAAAIC